MRKFLSRFFKNQSGATAVEFSFTCFIFIFMVLFVAEIARLAYVSAVLDLAVSEAAKSAKNASSNYRERFNRRLTQQSGGLWSFLTKEDAINFNIYYATSIEDMIKSGGTTADYKNKPLARYQLKYKYHPMFFPFPNNFADSILNREVLFVQEYERSKFMD